MQFLHLTQTEDMMVDELTAPGTDRVFVYDLFTYLLTRNPLV